MGYNGKSFPADQPLYSEVAVGGSKSGVLDPESLVLGAIFLGGLAYLAYRNTSQNSADPQISSPDGAAFLPYFKRIDAQDEARDLAGVRKTLTSLGVAIAAGGIAYFGIMQGKAIRKPEDTPPVVDTEPASIMEESEEDKKRDDAEDYAHRRSGIILSAGIGSGIAGVIFLISIQNIMRGDQAQLYNEEISKGNITLLAENSATPKMTFEHYVSDAKPADHGQAIVTVKAQNVIGFDHPVECSFTADYGYIEALAPYIKQNPVVLAADQQSVPMTLAHLNEDLCFKPPMKVHQVKAHPEDMQRFLQYSMMVEVPNSHIGLHGLESERLSHESSYGAISPLTIFPR